MRDYNEIKKNISTEPEFFQLRDDKLKPLLHVLLGSYYSAISARELYGSLHSAAVDMKWKISRGICPEFVLMSQKFRMPDSVIVQRAIKRKVQDNPKRQLQRPRIDVRKKSASLSVATEVHLSRTESSTTTHASVCAAQRQISHQIANPVVVISSTTCTQPVLTTTAVLEPAENQPTLNEDNLFNCPKCPQAYRAMKSFCGHMTWHAQNDPDAGSDEMDDNRTISNVRSKLTSAANGSSSSDSSANSFDGENTPVESNYQENEVVQRVWNSTSQKIYDTTDTCFRLLSRRQVNQDLISSLDIDLFTSIRLNVQDFAMHLEKGSGLFTAGLRASTTPTITEQVAGAALPYRITTVTELEQYLNLAKNMGHIFRHRSLDAVSDEMLAFLKNIVGTVAYSFWRSSE